MAALAAALNGATNSGTGADVTFSDTNGRLTATFNTAGAGMNANSIDIAFTDANAVEEITLPQQPWL